MPIYEWVSLGMLRQTDAFFALQAWLALLFLSSKCWYLMSELDPAYIEHSYLLHAYRIRHGKYLYQQPWIITQAWIEYCKQTQTITRRGTSRSRLQSQSRRNSNKNELIGPFGDRLKMMIRSELKMKSPPTKSRLGLKSNISMTFTSTGYSINQSQQQLPLPPQSPSTRHTASHTTQVSQLTQASLSSNINYNVSHEQLQLPMTRLSFESKNSGSTQIMYNDSDNENVNPPKPISIPKVNGHCLELGVTDSNNRNDTIDKIDEIDTRGTITIVGTIDDNDGMPTVMEQDEEAQQTMINGKNQRYRKCSVITLGLFLLGVGISILVSFTDNVENNYKAKCIAVVSYEDYNTTNWFSNNPEIAQFYGPHCERQVIRIFDEYPCECRKLRVAVSESTLKNISTLHRVFEKWHMLEGIFIYSQYSPPTNTQPITFTKEMLHLPHLRSLVIDAFNVEFNDDSIGDALKQNLVILELKNVQSDVHIPWKHIGQLTNLKVLSIAHIKNIASNGFDDAICSLTELVYFEVKNVQFVNAPTADLPQCIGTNWNQLKKFDISTGSGGTAAIGPQLFNLPNIEEINIVKWDLDIDSFKTFSDYSDKLRYVRLCWSNICEYTTKSDIVELEVLASNNSKLDEFNQAYTPCETPCTLVESGGGCSRQQWDDGVCDTECFSEACGWDNGDCNQLCQCDRDLWFNGICDADCNNTACEWDFRDCIPATNESCYYNESNVDDTCYFEWIYDDWCDANCVIRDECYHDNIHEREPDVCTCSHRCATVFSTVFKQVASYTEPVELVDENEVCEIWELIKLSSHRWFGVAITARYLCDVMYILVC